MKNQNQYHTKVHEGDFWNSLLSLRTQPLEACPLGFETESSSSKRTRNLREPITLVTDANEVFKELAYISRAKAVPSAFQETSEAGICALHAPDWLIKELEASVIPNFSKYHKVRESETIDWVENRVMPLIEIHEGYSNLEKYTILPHQDLKDAPYVALARDLNASGVLSNDSDIRDFGVRQFNRADLSELLYLARCEHATAMTRNFGDVGGRLAIMATDEAVKTAIRGFKTLPPAGKSILIGGTFISLALWLSNEKGRSQAHSLMEHIGFGAVKSGKFVGSGFVRVSEWQGVSSDIRDNYAQDNREI